MYKILVVDDDKVLQQSLKTALQYQQFDVDVADNGEEALNAVCRQKYDFVLMDVNMPKMDGITALNEIKKHDPSVAVVILTAHANETDRFKAGKLDADAYLEKPIPADMLIARIKQILKARSYVETSAFSAPALSLGTKTDQFVGESDAMQKVFGILSKLSKVVTPVLIRGESGTGKELVAKAIHYNGPRKDEKFVTVNCAAINDNLIESELFGHEKGAFTGANERKIGKFQFADGGTLFLDEIGDISPSMQVKLLRVLQEKTFTPVGSNREIKSDVRVIAASHKPFEEMIKTGTFREDLFYRLNVLPVYLPPLRERKTDIPHLIQYYINYFNGVHALSIKGMTSDAMQAVTEYAWPGNIRELRNVIEHAFIIESTETIKLSSLPDAIKKSFVVAPQAEESEHHDVEMIDYQDIKDSVLDEGSDGAIPEGYSFNFMIKDEAGQPLLDFQVAKEIFEKEFIIQALRIHKGKINQTAIKANIPKKTLLRKIEKHNINPKEYYE